MFDPETLGPGNLTEVERFRSALELERGFAFHVLVAETRDVFEAALARLPKNLIVLRPRPLLDTPASQAATEILAQLDTALEQAQGEPVLLDALIAADQPAWAMVVQRLNELRNGIERRHPAPLILAVSPGGEGYLGREAPDLWSRRGSGMRLRTEGEPAAAEEAWPLFLPAPPAEPRDFEQLCFELFKEVWNDPGAQRFGRSGQQNAGVDIFGQAAGRWVGVACKVRSHLRLGEVDHWTAKARNFSPKLHTFIIATTVRRDARLQKLATSLLTSKDLEVQVWFWDDIVAELFQRPELEARHFQIIDLKAKRGLDSALGDVTGAIRDAVESVALVDRSGDVSQRIAARVSLADALHQAGREEEALELLRQAEAMQAELQPAYPLLYSLQGFQYCDLLLSAPERAAWQRGIAPENLESQVATCREVQKRAERTWEWAVQNRSGLLDVAQDRLTLGRSHLFRAILEEAPLIPAKEWIEEALLGLRRSGDLTRVLICRLTRAWLRFVQGDESGGQAELEVVRDLAERNYMKHIEADAQLYRARFLRDQDALAQARGLIQKHGYFRRLEQLRAVEGLLA